MGQLHLCFIVMVIYFFRSLVCKYVILIHLVLYNTFNRLLDDDDSTLGASL